MPIGFSGGWRVRKSVWGCHFVETPCSIARVISSTSFFPRGYKVPKTSPAAAHRISGSMMEQKMMPPSTLCGCCAAPPINPVAANIYPGIAPATPWAALETKEDRDATAASARFIWHIHRVVGRNAVGKGSDKTPTDPGENSAQIDQQQRPDIYKPDQ